MKLKKKLYALVCQNDGEEERPIIMESYVDCSDYQSMSDRISKYRESYGSCWLVELPISIVDGGLVIDDERKVKER